MIITKKAVPTSLLEEKYPYNTSERDPHGNSQGIGAVNCCRKDLYPRGCRDPTSTSYLCKRDPTKS